MPGDSKETIRFKRLRRLAAEGMLQRSAGAAIPDTRKEIDKFTRDLLKGEETAEQSGTVPTPF